MYDFQHPFVSLLYVYIYMLTRIIRLNTYESPKKSSI